MNNNLKSVSMSRRNIDISPIRKSSKDESITILPTETNKESRDTSNLLGGHASRKLIAWNDIPDALVQRSLMTYVRRWVYGISHYADYAMQLSILLIEFRYISKSLFESSLRYLAIVMKNPNASAISS